MVLLEREVRHAEEISRQIRTLGVWIKVAGVIFAVFLYLLHLRVKETEERWLQWFEIEQQRMQVTMALLEEDIRELKEKIK